MVDGGRERSRERNRDAGNIDEDRLLVVESQCQLPGWDWLSMRGWNFLNL
jgi:hypothetical protein